jgi:hypothetical protein
MLPPGRRDWLCCIAFVTSSEISNLAVSRLG